jgi:hypothetical protein
MFLSHVLKCLVVIAILQSAVFGELNAKPWTVEFRPLESAYTICLEKGPASLASKHTPVSHKLNSGQKQSPLALDQIKELIANLPDESPAVEINDRGVIFKITEETLNELRRLGAGQQTIKKLASFISNLPPSEIFNFERPEVRLGDILTIYFDVKDPDGCEPQYFWSATAGRIQGAALQLNWIRLGYTCIQHLLT